MRSGFLGWNMCVLALRASGGSSLILAGLCRTISMNWNSYARPLLIPMLIRTLSPLSLLTCSPFPDHVPKAQSKRQLPVHQHFTDYRDKDSVIGTALNSAEVRDCQTPHPLSKHPQGLAVGAGWGHCASHRAKAARKDASCPILALKKPFLILIIKTEGTDSSYQSKVTNRKERGLHREASGPSKGWLKDEKARTLSWGQLYSCSHGNSGHYPGYVGSWKTLKPMLLALSQKCRATLRLLWALQCSDSQACFLTSSPYLKSLRWEYTQCSLHCFPGHSSVPGLGAQWPCEQMTRVWIHWTNGTSFWSYISNALRMPVH